MLKATVQRAAALGVTLTVEDAAVERIADEGFDPLYGARPLRRVIRAEVEDAVAELLLSGALHAGGAAPHRGGGRNAPRSAGGAVDPRRGGDVRKGSADG